MWVKGRASRADQRKTLAGRILRKRMKLEHLSLWEISQVLSLMCFEKTPVNSLFLHEKPVNLGAAIGPQAMPLHDGQNDPMTS